MNFVELTQFIAKTILGTPWWVWAVLLYLLFIGTKALQTRVIYLPKLFIIPVALSVIKYKIFINAEVKTLLIYCAGFVFASLLGAYIAFKEKIKIFKNKNYIELQGSYQTLSLSISFFCMKYIFGYLNASSQVPLEYVMLAEMFISGIFSGYFTGKALNYLYRAKYYA